jgi:hypothetical protein
MMPNTIWAKPLVATTIPTTRSSMNAKSRIISRDWLAYRRAVLVVFDAPAQGGRKGGES